MYRVSPFVTRFAGALLGGAALATLWVNLFPASYYDTIEWQLAELALPGWLAPMPLGLTPMSIVSDGLMALFFFFIGKELWEALILPRGALHGRQALLPMALALGGMAGAATVWTLASLVLETGEGAPPGAGWQVPLGADVVICFLVGRRVFGAGHPALHLLLLMTIATDILALLILGLTHPPAALRPAWLLLPLGAALALWLVSGRAPPAEASERARRARLHLWPALVAGLAAWLGVAASGLPPALGLLPILPAIAHANHSFGLFAEVEELLHDPLNRLAHALVWPLMGVLFLFGLTRGGVDLAAFAPTTLVTLIALWVGRPLGMLVPGLGLAALLGLRLPKGVSLRDILTIAPIMAMGFTLPVVTLDTALPGGLMQEAARLGLALSLLAGPAAILIARMRRQGHTSP